MQNSTKLIYCLIYQVRVCSLFVLWCVFFQITAKKTLVKHRCIGIQQGLTRPSKTLLTVSRPHMCLPMWVVNEARGLQMGPM